MTSGLRCFLQDAAMEKAKAGEGRNVEHVALEDDATLALATSQPTKRRKRKQETEAEQVWQAGHWIHLGRFACNVLRCTAWCMDDESN